MWYCLWTWSGFYFIPPEANRLFPLLPLIYCWVKRSFTDSVLGEWDFSLSFEVLAFHSQGALCHLSRSQHEPKWTWIGKKNNNKFLIKPNKAIKTPGTKDLKKRCLLFLLVLCSRPVSVVHTLYTQWAWSWAPIWLSEASCPQQPATPLETTESV